MQILQLRALKPDGSDDGGRYDKVLWNLWSAISGVRMNDAEKNPLIEARTLRGFHDRLPGEALVKERMLTSLKKTFEGFGYVPIETPHIEFAEILIKESSEEIRKQLYRFQDNGGRDVALRFDLTVPFARFVVQHRNEVGIPFKRYAIGNVFRGERPQAGRFREFTQCDFDFVGTESIGADAETVEVIAAGLKGLGIGKFLVRINNRKVMNGLSAMLGAGEHAGDILRVVDKIDKVGQSETALALKEEVGLDEKSVSALLDFIGLTKEKQGEELFRALAPYKEKNSLLGRGISELEELFAILQSLPIDPAVYCCDLTIARGLGYYTGIVYETILTSLPDYGSICGGGRYDNLTGTFSRDLLPGVGASFGVDRLIAALQELKLEKALQTPAQVLLVSEENSSIPLLHQTAHEMRSTGVNVEVYPDSARLKKQFEYAERKGHPFLLFVEQTESSVAFKLRNASTREQVIFASAIDAAGEIIQKLGK